MTLSHQRKIPTALPLHFNLTVGKDIDGLSLNSPFSFAEALLYGLCPERDAHVLTRCTLCDTFIRPQMLVAHVESHRLPKRREASPELFDVTANAPSDVGASYEAVMSPRGTILRTCSIDEKRPHKNNNSAPSPSKKRLKNGYRSPVALSAPHKRKAPVENIFEKLNKFSAHSSPPLLAAGLEEEAVDSPSPSPKRRRPASIKSSMDKIITIDDEDEPHARLKEAVRVAAANERVRLAEVAKATKGSLKITISRENGVVQQRTAAGKVAPQVPAFADVQSAHMQRCSFVPMKRAVPTTKTVPGILRKPNGVSTRSNAQIAVLLLWPIDFRCAGQARNLCLLLNFLFLQKRPCSEFD